MTVVMVCEFDACPDHDGPCIPWAAADSFACPCLVCPCCGWINDDPEQTHPEDGLAGPCGRCRYFEWWAVSGPHRDGRHMHSETERDEWNAYDTAVMEGRA